MPGQTLAALQAGSTTYKLVVAIEGYANLLTDADTAKAVTAWAGTDYAAALGGIVVDLQQQQKIDPWDPLQGGGTATIYVPQGPSDTFGIDTHLTSTTRETELTVSLDRDDTTITVQDNGSLNSPFYVGTEAIGFSGTGGSTTLTGATRGTYSPFAAYGTGSPRFSHDHRVGFVDYATSLAPIASRTPRVWIGRWVGIWAHSITASDGTLNAKAEAHLLFAGKIAEIRDDPETQHTIVQLRHVLDVIKEGVVGRDQWTGELSQGIYLESGLTFTMTDTNNGDARTATPLTVAAGSPTSNLINPGYYSVQDVYTFLNNWLAEECDANRLYADYYYFETVVTNSGLRCEIRWRMTGTAGKVAHFSFGLPQKVANLIGFKNLTVVEHTVYMNTDSYRDSGFEPQAVSVFALENGSVADIRAHIKNETGVFVDNYAVLPDGFRYVPDGGLDWGVFLLDNSRFIVAAKSGSDLLHVFPAPAALAGVASIQTGLDNYSRAIDDPTPITVKQVFVIESTLAGLLKILLYNTGTNGYNHPTYDVLGTGFGLGIPGTLLGAAFDASVDALPGASQTLVAIVEKPMKLGGENGLLTGDLLLRRAFPIWKNGGVQFTCWQAPSTTGATLSLDETTKARPAGSTEDHRSVTTLTDEWVRSIVKIEYDRDITNLSGDDFANVLTLEDRVALDDAGGEGKPFTISARNTYSQYVATGAGVAELAPAFLASFTMFSRPIRKTRRSISPKYYEGYAPGDIVLITDKYARDPATGRRTVSARPGTITRHHYTIGGANPGNPSGTRSMTGEIDVVFLDLNRIAEYAPSARVDDTFTSGGYTNGYNPAGNGTFRCKAHEYSETTEGVDAAKFQAGDKIVIIQVDTESAPITWSRTIATVSSSDIALTAALAAPAFDTTKKYVITYDNFSIAVTNQLSKSYQADQVDGFIAGAAPPFQYGLSNAPTTATTSVHTDAPELIPADAYADGKARDVGYDRAMCRLLNNLHDHKTRHVGPVLANTVMTNTTYSTGGGYRMLALQPVFLTKERAGANNQRAIKVAPWFRSSDGTSVTIRVSLITQPPIGTSVNDVTLPGFYQQATWTTSSTTWQQGAETSLTCGVKQPNAGIGYLVLEGTIKSETRGLGQMNETERIYIP